MLGNKKNKQKPPDFTATKQKINLKKQVLFVERNFLMFTSQFSLNKANTDTNVQIKQLIFLLFIRILGMYTAN